MRFFAKIVRILREMGVKFGSKSGGQIWFQNLGSRPGQRVPATPPGPRAPFYLRIFLCPHPWAKHQ